MVIEIPTDLGRFRVEDGAYRQNDSGDGVVITLQFIAGSSLAGVRFGIVQVVRSTIDGDAVPAYGPNPFLRPPLVAAGAVGAGFRVDQQKSRNPLYVVSAPDDLDGVEKPSLVFGALGVGGQVDAFINDSPHLPGAPDCSQVFETTCLALGGYCGSVTWGWQKTGGRFELFDVALASASWVTDDFLAAAELWNDLRAPGGGRVGRLPSQRPGPRFT